MAMPISMSESNGENTSENPEWKALVKLYTSREIWEQASEEKVKVLNRYLNRIFLLTKEEQQELLDKIAEIDLREGNKQ